MRLITIKAASELVGLSVTTIRRRVAAGTLPALRANSQRGKLLFDANLLVQVLKQENLSNLRDYIDNDTKEPKYTTTKACEGFEEDKTVIPKEPPKLSDKGYFDKMAELGLEQAEQKEPTTT